MMKSQKRLWIFLLLCYTGANYGAASFAPLLPVSSLLITTTAATLLDTTIINIPGNYYLGIDISGPLVINSPQVFVNLSGYTINGGITLTPIANTVAVYNGFVDAAGGVGITISEGLKNILLAQLVLTDCLVGVQANGTVASPIARIALDQVEVQAAAGDGAFLTYCQQLLILDSIFVGNGAVGLFLDNCSKARVEGSSFLNNTSTGLFMDFASNMQLVANNFTTNGTFGCFVADNSLEITLTDCTAANNTLTGFFNEGTEVNFYGCSSNSNGGDGFTFDVTSTNCIVQNNSAKNNVGCGFNDLVAASVSYVSNLAHGNGDDYCVSSAPVLAGVAPYYFASITAGAVGVSSWTNVQA